VNAHNDELSELLVVSELTTSSIEKAVIEEFDNYVECIDSDKKSLQNVAAAVSDVKKQPTQNNGKQIQNVAAVVSNVKKQDIQNNGKPTDQEIQNFTNHINKIALEKNGGYKLSLQQENLKKTYIRKYKENGQETIDELDAYLESTKNRRKTKGAFFDVSSSEVDISEFSLLYIVL